MEVWTVLPIKGIADCEGNVYYDKQDAVDNAKKLNKLLKKEVYWVVIFRAQAYIHVGK